MRHPAILVLRLLVTGQGGTEWSVGCQPNGQSLIYNRTILGAKWRHGLLQKSGRKLSPIGVSGLPQGWHHRWDKARQVALRDFPPMQNFYREVRESSPPTTRPGARWHITAALCAAIPRMRQSGVGKFVSDQRGQGCERWRRQMLRGRWHRARQLFVGLCSGLCL